MTDVDALYRAILAEPADDTRRLIYADALEEEGDAQRAAFIRLHIVADSSPAYHASHFRADRFEDRLGLASSQRLPALPDGLNWADRPLRRGMPSAIVAIDARAFIDSAEILFTIAPVECLTINAIRPGEVRPLAECPYLDRIAELCFPMGIGAWGARLLFNSPNLSSLRTVRVGPALTVAATAGALVRSRAFRQLETLAWRDDEHRTGAVVGQLMHYNKPTALTRIDLSGNRIQPMQLNSLSAARSMSSVVELDLSDNALFDDNERHYETWRHFDQLKMLRLQRIRYTSGGSGTSLMASLTSGKFLGQLHGLDLSETPLNWSRIEMLTGANCLDQLAYLDLRETRLFDSGIKLLASNPAAAGLRVLNAGRNSIEDEGALAIADSPYLGGLEHLDLTGNSISVRVVELLHERYGEGLLV